MGPSAVATVVKGPENYETGATTEMGGVRLATKSGPSEAAQVKGPSLVVPVFGLIPTIIVVQTSNTREGFWSSLSQRLTKVADKS